MAFFHNKKFWIMCCLSPFSIEPTVTFLLESRIQDFGQGGSGVLTPGGPGAQNLLKIA